MHNRQISSALMLAVLASISPLLAADGSPHSDDSIIEEVVVTSSLVDTRRSELGSAIHLLGGDDIASAATRGLGDTLDSLLGVSSADYGSAVSQPIIRGLAGDRVKILNNGLVVRDVAGLGADHSNDVDLHNVEQLEVIRGPSSLLHTNGSIGGIINIVDNTIARRDVTEAETSVGLEAQTVSDGDSKYFSHQSNLGGLNVSVSFKDSKFEDFEVPSGAVTHSEDEADDHEEEGHDEDHEEEHEEEHEDIRSIANSDHRLESQRIGISKVGDWGHLGASYRRNEGLYGIPFHGDEREEDYAEEGDHEEEDHEGERIFSTTTSDTLNFEGSLNLGHSVVKGIDYYFRETDYELIEQHAEEEGHMEAEGHEEEDDHDAEGPTLFANDAREYGVIVDLTNDLLSQKLAIEFVSEDTAISGAEAFMSPVDNDEFTLGYYASKVMGTLTLELGIRHDQIERSGSVALESHEEEHDADEAEHDEEAELAYFAVDTSNTSVAVGLKRSIGEHLTVDLNLSRLERAPSSVELFMNGPHLATGRFEVGNPALTEEKGTSAELALQYRDDRFFGTLAFFNTNIDDYIYLQDSSEFDHGLVVSNYLQQDAEFDGYEMEIGAIFPLGQGDLTLSFARDAVTGEFAGGGYLPRITPERNIYSAVYQEETVGLSLEFKDVASQRDVSGGEEATDGYQMLGLRAVKSFQLENGIALRVSVFGNNLLDDVARNHSSFVKQEVPLPGRNYGAKFSATF